MDLKKKIYIKKKMGFPLFTKLVVFRIITEF